MFLAESTYRGAGKSLARQGRKQTNVSVRMEWISFGALSCGGGGGSWGVELGDSSRLDGVEIARVTWHASKLVSFLVGLRTYQHPSTCELWGYCAVIRCRMNSTSLCLIFNKKDRVCELIHIINSSSWSWGWEVFPTKLAQQSVLLHHMLLVDTLLLHLFWCLCYEKPRMGFYEFGNWNRILKGMYALSHFSSVSEKVLTLQDISTNKKFLKSVEVSQSTGGGGGGGARPSVKAENSFVSKYIFCVP